MLLKLLSISVGGEKWEHPKSRGKEWQATPKNLPRMHRTRAIPVAWLNCGLCPDRPKGWIPLIIIISWLIMCEIISSLPYKHNEKHLPIQYSGSAYDEACPVFLCFPIDTLLLSIYTFHLWHPWIPWDNHFCIANNKWCRWGGCCVSGTATLGSRAQWASQWIF